MTAPAALITYLSDLPGRCSSCGFHVPSQAHRADCSQRSEWSTFVAALRKSVRVDGTVHQGDVRPLIRGRIEPKHIGQLYRRARAEGLLREVGLEESDDVIGRNSDKLSRVYKLRVTA